MRAAPEQMSPLKKSQFSRRRFDCDPLAITVFNCDKNERKYVNNNKWKSNGDGVKLYNAADSGYGAECEQAS
jgi:hypothetical protein